MADVPRTLRLLVYRRDCGRCCCCSADEFLSVQHRARVGSGGSVRMPGPSDLVTACVGCNAAFESAMQTYALVLGWKVRTWANAAAVPVFYRRPGVWALLRPNGTVAALSVAEACDRMRAVYGDEWDRWRDSLPVELSEVSG